MSAFSGPVTMVLTVTGDQGAWVRPELGNWGNSGTLYTPLSSIQLDNKSADNSTVVLIKLNPAQLTGLHEIRLRRGPEKSSDGKTLGINDAAANAQGRLRHFLRRRKQSGSTRPGCFSAGTRSTTSGASACTRSRG